MRSKAFRAATSVYKDDLDAWNEYKKAITILFLGNLKHSCASRPPQVRKAVAHITSGFITYIEHLKMYLTEYTKATNSAHPAIVKNASIVRRHFRRCYSCISSAEWMHSHLFALNAAVLPLFAGTRSVRIIGNRYTRSNIAQALCSL